MEDGIAQVEAAMAAQGIDALVAIGGDDTLSVAARLAEHGANVVGLPKTVDFDLAVTEYCIGFDSAVAIVTESLDRLHTTAASHHRVMVCEVMGRDTGWLAVMGGIAGGADLCLIPEFPVHLDEVVRQIAQRDAEGKTSSIVVVAEGAEIEGLAAEASGPTDAFGHVNLARRALAEQLADAVEGAPGHESRATVRGHVQRGGSPVARDRIWPSRLGVAAVDAIRSGASGVCAAVVGDAEHLVPLADMVAEQKRVPASIYRVFSELS
jgi:6-phosphofructokinase 1